jgi:hypothetical protein
MRAYTGLESPTNFASGFTEDDFAYRPTHPLLRALVAAGIITILAAQFLAHAYFHGGF